MWFVIHDNTPTGSSPGSSAIVSTDNDDAPTDPLDQLSSADIAVSMARMSNSDTATPITNQADDMQVELSVPPVDTIVVTKPQAVSTSLKSNQDIKEYVVQPGDTLASIAAKFNVTSDSISWSNSLPGGNVSVGSTLLIPPVNGIVYTVAAGDTPDSLAQKYRASKEQIIAYNDAELSGLKVGERIIIPNGQQPTPTNNRRSSSSSSSSYSFNYNLGGGYNGYDRGYCTWYVANRRAEVGKPIPAGLGNAKSWDDRAPAAGFSTGRTPRVHAAAVTSQTGAGHVVFVERINDDGSIWVSEMNSSGYESMDTNSRKVGGWGKRDYKLFPADKAATFTYIY